MSDDTLVECVECGQKKKADDPPPYCDAGDPVFPRRCSSFRPVKPAK